MVVDSHDNLWVAQADNGLSRILHVSEHGSPPVIERAAKSDLTSPQTHALFGIAFTVFTGTGFRAARVSFKSL